MNNNEKLRGAEIQTDNKLLRWLENFWYHYKWTVLIVSFFVIIGIVCTLQMCNNKEEDIKLLYAGPVQMIGEQGANLESVMEFIMPEDFNKNGEKDAVLLNYHVLSEMQIKDIEAQTDAAGNRGYVDRNRNVSNNEDFYKYIQTGDAAICFVDLSIYENLRKHDRLLELSEALGYAYEGSADGYGIKLGDTDIYASYGALRVLPEDTVVCILRPLVAGKTSKPEMYAYEKSMFKAIVEFETEK